ncbi:Ca2+:H+ antiporter [Pedobacter rhizosphaerae]|uniref:Ca2+:H+ antiporter n=2 Tax=Pedobacter rhizosphaerae TaxID=390241 RepID=A0A1H9N5Q0_9SPHI|nr:Ca2+:H+ antiporter [Pedobacter rhizosphaerae]
MRSQMISTIYAFHRPIPRFYFHHDLPLILSAVLVTIIPCPLLRIEKNQNPPALSLLALEFKGNLMLKKINLPIWTMATPLLSVIFFFIAGSDAAGMMRIIIAFLLIGSVLSSVHHAEVIAHRVGEPFGTIILAIAITTIEVALIVSLMLSGGEGEKALARDTVFAAVMIIITAIVGLCILKGSITYREQRYHLAGVNAALITLMAIVILTLILPNFTVSGPVGEYSESQLIFVSVVSLILYGGFIFVQTFRHRDYFLPKDSSSEDDHAPAPNKITSGMSLVFLLISLAIVVLLAKYLSYDLEQIVLSVGAPKSLVGVIIAAIVLLPEGLAAYRAVKANRLQTSLNLALGSALASIGLTIPAVAIVAIITGYPLVLGIDARSMVLLLLSMLTLIFSLATGKTNIQQGVVLLVIFACYLFYTIVP